MIKTITLLILLLSLHQSADSQTLRMVDSLERVKKGCIEDQVKGRSTMYCLGRFRDQMDSLLIAVYNTLYNRSSESYQHTLAAEQKEWLAKKIDNDQQVDKDTTTIKAPAGAAEMRFFKYDAKTAFIRDRVKYLIGKL